jgi:hypothetical protein
VDVVDLRLVDSLDLFGVEVTSFYSLYATV